VEADKYWAALKQANADIVARRNDPSFRTSLRVDPSRALFLATAPVQFAAKASLRPLAAEAAVVQPLDRQPAAAPLRRLGVYRAYGQAGKAIAFRVQSQRLANLTNGTVASVLGPDMGLLAEERVGVGETKDISVHCAAAGVYTLVCQSGEVCNTVNCDAPGFVLDGGKSGLHFMSRVQPFYFHVPKGVKEFKLTGEGQGIERFNLKIVAADGRLVFEKEDVSARETFNVKVPEGQDGQPWLLDLARPTHGVLEDVEVKFSDNVPPYLSPAKERLLVPTE
jgi:hypothetical protein